MEDSVCAVCTEVIQGKILTALGKNYHPEHFTCVKCKQPITGSRFQAHDEQPYCEKDYAESFSKRCWACKKPIIEKVISALNHDWHQEHFVCDACKTPLVGNSFYERNSKPYCSDCFLTKFADKCALCNKPIASRAIIALSAKWHQECFKCEKCGEPVTDTSFHVENGKPICSKCCQ